MQNSKIVKKCLEDIRAAASLEEAHTLARLALWVQQEGSKVDVVLVTKPELFINAIKELRALTNLGLKECKDLLETPGSVLLHDVTPEVAQHFVSLMDSFRGSVRFK